MAGLEKSQHLKLEFQEIKTATNNFETCIGKGGYGRVYKGQLSISGKLTTVAVKRLNKKFGQGSKEFLTEINLLTGQQHPNLISLLGYCEEGKEKIIVYEFVEHGSLDRYIRHNVDSTYTLTWPERLRICIDAACGLDHLHSHVGKHQTIIHRDIKSANILLDENWVAKISDLGLSKLSFNGLDRSVVITYACGTLGYCEPEYIINGTLTKKSDIYSFGMVLFEVLCGKLCNIVDKDGVLLTAKLAKECYENKKLHDIIDPSLREQMSSNSMSKFSAIAYRCLHDDREHRPTMDVVKKELEEALKIHVSDSMSVHSSSRPWAMNLLRQLKLPFRRNQEKMSLWGDGTIEPAPMETQTLAVQPILVPSALQVDEIARPKQFDDIVIINQAEKEDEATVITINCPDKTGLGCDICRTILVFGLNIVRGDVTTDGEWCNIVFWVIGKPGIIWSLLKQRLLEECPSVSSANALESESPKPTDVFLLKICCYDRQGQLHDVTHLLCELELVIQRVKVSTTPDGMVMGNFYVIDTRKLLHTANRMKDTHDHLKSVLGDTLISFDIEMVDPDFTAYSHGPPSFIPASITEDTFNLESIHSYGMSVTSDDSPSRSHTLAQIVSHDHNEDTFNLDSFHSNGVTVMADNSLGPSHTLVRIACHDYKGLLYDIMRTLKDCNIQISHGRFTKRENEVCELEFFIVQADGKKILDPSKLNVLCSRIRMELFRPLRVVLVNCELLVANLAELCGNGRPLVFYDITLALKMLNMNIFSAEVSRHLIGGRVWEVYRVLLDEGDKLSVLKGLVEETVRSTLMGWDQS